MDEHVAVGKTVRVTMDTLTGHTHSPVLTKEKLGGSFWLPTGWPVSCTRLQYHGFPKARGQRETRLHGHLCPLRLSTTLTGHEEGAISSTDTLSSVVLTVIFTSPVSRSNAPNSLRFCFNFLVTVIKAHIASFSSTNLNVKQQKSFDFEQVARTNTLSTSLLLQSDPECQVP